MLTLAQYNRNAQKCTMLMHLMVINLPLIVSTTSDAGASIAHFRNSDNFTVALKCQIIFAVFQ